MSNKKMLLPLLMGSILAEQENKDFYEFTNPYAGLSGVTYNPGYGSKSYSKFCKPAKFLSFSSSC